jgi:hypothetical protein
MEDVGKDKPEGAGEGDGDLSILPIIAADWDAVDIL